MKRRSLISVAAAVAMSVSLAACGADSDPLADEPAASGAAGGSVTVGSANFPESQLLAEIYSQALEAKGVKVTRKFNIGAREVYLKALQDGSISLLPEYNGALLAALSPNGIPAGVSSSDTVLAELKKVLPAGTEVLAQSAAEDKDTLTVSADTASKNNLKTIEDLKAVAPTLIAGGGPEFTERQQGLKGLKEVYGVEFKEYKPLDPGGPLTVTALKDGDIQVANLFSTDSSIVTNKFVTLADPKNLFTSQNVLPLIRTEANNATVTGALDAVSGKLTTENLTSYLAQVQVDKKDITVVAKAFLSENGLS